MGAPSWSKHLHLLTPELRKPALASKSSDTSENLNSATHASENGEIREHGNHNLSVTPEIPQILIRKTLLVIASFKAS